MPTYFDIAGRLTFDERSGLELLLSEPFQKLWDVDAVNYRYPLAYFVDEPFGHPSLPNGIVLMNALIRDAIRKDPSVRNAFTTKDNVLQIFSVLKEHGAL